MDACTASGPRRREEVGKAIADRLAEVLTTYAQVWTEGVDRGCMERGGGVGG